MDSYSGIYYLIWVKSIKTQSTKQTFLCQLTVLIICEWLTSYAKSINNYVLRNCFSIIATDAILWETPITVYPLGANE